MWASNAPIILKVTWTKFFNVSVLQKNCNLSKITPSTSTAIIHKTSATHANLTQPITRYTASVITEIITTLYDTTTTTEKLTPTTMIHTTRIITEKVTTMTYTTSTITYKTPATVSIDTILKAFKETSKIAGMLYLLSI